MLAPTKPASTSTANGFARHSSCSIDPAPLEFMTVPSWHSTRRMAESYNEQTLFAVKVLWASSLSLSAAREVVRDPPTVPSAAPLVLRPGRPGHTAVYRRAGDG